MADGTDKSQQHDDSGELDDVLDQFEKAEAARRRSRLLYVVVALVIAGGLFGFVLVFRADIFAPTIDVKKGEKEVLARTNDPQCRNMIAQVEKLSDRYMQFEPTIDKQLLGDDPAAIQKIRDEVARIQQRLDEIEEYSHQANLRFSESRKQLADWFDYVALELSFVDRLAKEQLAKLKDDADAAKKNKDQKDKAAAGADDAGNDKPDGVVVAGGDKAKASSKTKKAPKKTPQERKEGALLDLHDAFQKFRVWHTASLHPCGAADKGETPWHPPAAGKASKPAKPAH